MTMNHPSLCTGDVAIDAAFGIALRDIECNVHPYKGDLFQSPKPCLMAGRDYDTPWTRDASFNTWFGAGLLMPEIARDTMLSVLTRDEQGLRIGGQYWDAIVWATGAWHLYLYTGDSTFLATAFDAVNNSLAYFERTELDTADGLFRGAACFQDGVSAYPDMFVDNEESCSGIFEWVDRNPAAKTTTGFGLPMKALSTNCLYYHAYVLVNKMAQCLGRPADPQAQRKAEALREAINRHFWDAGSGSYRYLLDANDNRERQEGFGHAFSILFGVADDARIASVFRTQHLTAHGIPCVWPQYERYASVDGTSFGRHSGTIWPQVNVAWAAAASLQGRSDIAWKELRSLADKACRDDQFAEIYHPVTGQIYGGMQENGRGIAPWASCSHQTWCATGFVHMVLTCLFGMRFGPGGITFVPYLPDGMEVLDLKGLPYRRMVLDVRVEKCAPGQEGVYIDGREPARVLPAELSGAHCVRVAVA